MNRVLEYAFKTDSLVDITTVGWKTGRPRTIEIELHNIDASTFIRAFPGRRHWYANWLADSRFTFHPKQSHTQDLLVRAIPVTKEPAWRQIL